MVERSSAGDALTELVIETFRLNGALLSAGNQLTRPHGLTSARWQVMGAIAQDPSQALTMAQIARRMGLARQGVRRIVNDLVELGMLVLNENVDHQRSKLCAITKRGQNALRAIQRDQVEWADQLGQGLREPQIRQAIRLMKAVREQLETTTNEEKP